MARPQKQNADYFPHDANERNNPPIIALRRKFSHTGYAAWNYLRETLTGSDNFRIEWDDVTVEILAADYMMDTAELAAVVEYATKIGLLKREGGAIYAPEHRDSLQPLLLRRERDRVKSENQGSNDISDNDNQRKPADNETETVDNDVITRGNGRKQGGNGVSVADNHTETVDNTTTGALSSDYRGFSSRESKSKSYSYRESKSINTHTVSFKRKGVKGEKQNFRDFLVWVEGEFPEIHAMAEPFTEEQAAAILDKYNDEDIIRIIEAIDNKGGYKNKNAFSTFNSYVAHDNILKARKNIQLYTYGQKCDMVCGGGFTDADFESKEIDGVRCWYKKIDALNARL